MRSSVEPIKGVASDFNAELVGNSRNVKQAVCGTGDGGMDKNSVFKTVHGHKITGAHMVHGGQFYRQLSGLVSILNQVRACGGRSPQGRGLQRGGGRSRAEPIPELRP